MVGGSTEIVYGWGINKNNMLKTSTPQSLSPIINGQSPIVTRQYFKMSLFNAIESSSFSHKYKCVFNSLPTLYRSCSSFLNQ